MKIGRLAFAGSLSLFLLSSLALSPKSAAQASANHRVEYTYAVDQNANGVYAYKAGSGGMLKPLAKPAFATGSAPSGVAVDPSGRFLYVANLLSNNVSGYSILEDGTLKPVPGSPFAGQGRGGSPSIRLEDFCTLPTVPICVRGADRGTCRVTPSTKTPERWYPFQVRHSQQIRFHMQWRSTQQDHSHMWQTTVRAQFQYLK